MNIERIWPDWTIEEQLGKGSYGTVYRIRKTTSGSGRAEICSALKVIRIPASGSEIEDLYDQGLDEQSVLRVLKRDVELLENEIRVMISLAAASGIVKIEDYYIEELTSPPGYVVYIRMELLESLTSYVRRKGELTQEEALKMTSDLCEALSACESRNVIHRDIKPANIFRNEFGQFKLGDFGVAKQMQGTASAGTRVGTPSFEAPETFLGNRYDHTVDIYALGIVLYTYLNKGRKPFYPPYPQDITRDDMQTAMEKRLSGEPIPKIPGVDKTLFGILRKACAYQPEDRYPDAEAFRKDLERYSRGEHFTVSVNRHKTTAADRKPQDPDISVSDVSGEDGTLLLSQQPKEETTGRKTSGGTERKSASGGSAGRPSGGGSGKKGLVIGIIGAVIVAAGGAAFATKMLNRDTKKESAQDEGDEKAAAAATPTPEQDKASADTPTKAAEPTKAPTAAPTKAAEPTKAPTAAPTKAAEPTKASTVAPMPTATPTPEPTKVPTSTPIPTSTPTPEPTKVPTATPAPEPTKAPPATPTPVPIKMPTAAPIVAAEPIKVPADIQVPVKAPAAAPTQAPTQAPTTGPKHVQLSPGDLSIPSFSSGLTEEDIGMQIPDTALRYNGHSYFIFDVTDIASWEQARDFCLNMGGYLAVIGSKDENKELFRYANTYMEEYGAEGVFFGYADSAQEGTWEWVPQETSDFVNWNPGQPNGGTESNYCEFPRQFSDGTINTTASWSDASFSSDRSIGFICEWPGVS